MNEASMKATSSALPAIRALRALSALSAHLGTAIDTLDGRNTTA